MTRRIAAIGLVCALLVLCGGAGGAAALDLSLARYPGAVRPTTDEIGLDSLAEGTVSRRAEYWTDDSLREVRNWYAERMQLAPSTTVYAATGGCLMLTQADLLYRFEHRLSVVICERGKWTQVVVNEKVAVLP